MQYSYPTSYTLLRIEQDKLPQLRPSKVIADIFPEIQVDTWAYVWEQYDNVSGLMHGRGLNGAPLPVRALGIREMTTPPGVYGDMLTLDERKLTESRAIGSPNEPVAIGDLITNGSDQLATREYSRWDYLAWTTLQTGMYAGVDRRGVVFHNEQYTPQVFNAAVGWGTPSTSTPLQDIRHVHDIGELGTSAKFDSGANIYMTTAKYNQLVANTNAGDLGGRRDEYGATYQDLPNVNKLLLRQDLPKINLVQDGYWDDIPANSTYGQFVKYLQDNKVVVVGRRPNGTAVGKNVLVRNVNAPGAVPVGRYFHINDLNIDGAGPRRIELHRGFSGMVCVEFPRAIYIINC